MNIFQIVRDQAAEERTQQIVSDDLLLSALYSLSKDREAERERTIFTRDHPKCANLIHGLSMPSSGAGEPENPAGRPPSYNSAPGLPAKKSELPPLPDSTKYHNCVSNPAIKSDLPESSSTNV